MKINRMSERKYKYHTVNLPESLAKKIEEVIESVTMATQVYQTL